MPSKSDLEKPIKGSPVKVAYHRGKLARRLSRADPRGFLQMMWAVDALHLGRVNAAAKVLTYPHAATDQSAGSPYAIHQWELETLATQYLLTPSAVPSAQSEFDAGKFGSVADLINELRKVEDLECAVYLGDGHVDIFTELHRIAQRQFHWQHGYFNHPQLYRYAFIYGQGKCAEYFQERYGFPITDLSFVGMALYQQTSLIPWIPRSIEASEIGLTKELIQKTLPLLLSSMPSARDQTAALAKRMNDKHGRELPTAFLPSNLRRFPLLCIEDDSSDFIAPIADMLLLRVTSGLYFDIVDGGQGLINEANEHFEAYCASIIDAMMAHYTVSRAKRYKLKKGAMIDTPDILVKYEDRTVLVVECKASKLTYLAQFSEDPFETARAQYEQIANGVFQLWRLFSHVRRGLLPEPIDDEAAALVLTLEAFGLMHRELKERILGRASELADNEEGITAEDRRPVIFCPIDHFEGVLSRTNEDSFLAVLRAAHEDRYKGWELPQICQKEAEGKDKIEPKRFPFDLRELLPWWVRIEEYGKARRSSAG